MKTSFLLILFSTISLAASSQDEFTNGNIFDFNIGDLFQYSYDVPGQGFGLQYEFLDKYYSEDMDTVFYVRERITWEVEGFSEPEFTQTVNTIYYTDLDSVYQIAGAEISYDNGFCNDSLKRFQVVDGNDFEPIVTVYQYGLGLGRVSYDYGNSGEGVQNSYILSYYSKNGETCGNYNSIFEDVSVSEIDKQSVQFFPNPSSGNVKLVSSFQVHTVKVYDQMGRCLKIYKDLNSRNMRLNLSEFPQGVYVLNVQGTHANHRQKIILE